MKRPIALALAAVTFCGLLLALQLQSSATAGQFQEPATAVELAGDLVVWRPAVDYQRLTLVVVGRQGTVFEREFYPGEPVYMPLYDQEGDPLPDGSYTWELRFEHFEASAYEEYADPADAGLPKSQHGYFQIQAGSATGPDLPDPVFDTVSPVDDQILRGRTCIGSQCADGESFPPGDGLLKLKGSSAVLFFEDTSSPAAFTNDWRIEANDGADLLAIDDVDGGTTPLTIEAGAPTNTLYLNAAGNVGLGTAAPQQSLHIRDTVAVARLEQNSGSLAYDLRVGESAFQVDQVGISAGVFQVDAGAPSNSLRIRGDGDIGVGFNSPSASLHVRRSDGSAQIRVEEASGSTAQRTLFVLQNNGGPIFELNDSNSGTSWSFLVNSVGGFGFNRVGTGGFEFSITSSGRVLIGPGAATVFNLSPTGNLTIAGNLTANGIFYPSDRALKENIEPVDPVQLLGRVKELDVSRWNFIQEKGVQRLGPMAQDFHALFGLGTDDRHINPMDVASVALAAVQGLNQLVEERDRRLAEQEARIAALEARLARIEARLDGQARDP